MFDEWNIRKFRQRQYGLTVLTIELEARLYVGETAEVLRGLLIEASDVVAVLFQLGEGFDAVFDTHDSGLCDR